MRAGKILLLPAHEAHGDAAALCKQDIFRPRPVLLQNAADGKQRIVGADGKPLLAFGKGDLAFVELAQECVDEARHAAFAELFQKLHGGICNIIARLFEIDEIIKRNFQEHAHALFGRLFGKRRNAAGKISIVLQNAVHRFDGAGAVDLFEVGARKGEFEPRPLAVHLQKDAVRVIKRVGQSASPL